MVALFTGMIGPYQDALGLTTVFYVEDAIRPHALLSLASTLGFYSSVFQRTKAHCDDVIDRLRLRDFLRSRVCDLSKGTAKRFLIAIGVLSTQPVLMLDEPFDVWI